MKKRTKQSAKENTKQKDISDIEALPVKDNKINANPSPKNTLKMEDLEKKPASRVNHQPIKKVMKKEANFLSDIDLSSEKPDLNSEPKEEVTVEREFVEPDENKEFKIDIKKYKLWSMANLSKNNKFLSLVVTLINNDLVAPNNLGKLSIEDLKNLLEFRFSPLFKEYIRDSKVTKLKLEARFDELVRKNEKEYEDLKTKLEYDHNSKTEVFEKGLSTINEELKILNEKLNVLNQNVKTEINLTKKKKNLLLLVNDKDRKATSPVDAPLKQASDAEVASWKKQISDINEKIAVLSTKKDKIIERINKENLDYTNKLDYEFIEKQKIKTRFEVDRIEVLIFLRENLVALNRTIRDIKIQIGIKNVQANNDRSEQIFDDIAEALNRTKQQFELLDNISSTDNKIKVEQSVDTSTRIVDLKTGESY